MDDPPMTVGEVRWSADGNYWWDGANWQLAPPHEQTPDRNNIGGCLLVVGLLLTVVGLLAWVSQALQCGGGGVGCGIGGSLDSGFVIICLVIGIPCGLIGIASVRTKSGRRH